MCAIGGGGVSPVGNLIPHLQGTSGKAFTPAALEGLRSAPHTSSHGSVGHP